VVLRRVQCVVEAHLGPTESNLSFPGCKALLFILVLVFPDPSVLETANTSSE